MGFSHQKCHADLLVQFDYAFLLFYIVLICLIVQNLSLFQLENLFKKLANTNTFLLDSSNSSVISNKKINFPFILLFVGEWELNKDFLQFHSFEIHSSNKYSYEHFKKQAYISRDL